MSSGAAEVPRTERVLGPDASCGSALERSLARKLPDVIERVSEFLERNRSATLCAVVAALTLLAWTNRFIQDDAFISFRYAQNLVEGAGLTWNSGERVEGYTNFLWTLLMAIPFWVGVDPVSFSQALGLGLYPGTLLFAYRISLSATGSVPVALLSLLLLGTNYTFSIYATGGLETQLHVFLLLGVTALALWIPDGSTTPSPMRAGLISLLAAAAILTRMDSAIFLCVLYAYLGIELKRPRQCRDGSRGRVAALLLIPGGVMVMAWFAWKLSYYGDIFPNTYYAKMVSLSESWWPGLRFLWVFIRSYWLLPVLVLPLLLVRPIAKRGNRQLALLGLMALAGVLYAIRIGGDFMEFRVLVPVLPYLYIPLAWIMISICPRPLLSMAVVLIVMAGSIAHAYRFVWDYGIESVARLEGHLYDPKEAWIKTGQVLGELFGDAEGPALVAVTAAGAIPFYSRLPAIDMYGVTDPWVARNGLRTDPDSTNPGHHRRATFEYLTERGVNLVIGRPWVDEREPGPRPPFGLHGLARFAIHDVPTSEELPRNAVMEVLEIDLDTHHRLYVLYLMRNQRIDAVVRERGIRRHNVRLRRDLR